jgi:vancomycin aglycone glucosyltransferase
VYLGFGSTRQVDERGRLLLEAARRGRARAIISRGSGEVPAVGSGADYLSIGDVSHERLFARVAAVVHHGGAGTMTAAARAGKPR